MEKSWKDIKNILCIRLDNMGDLVMSSPAIRALKQSFRCDITLLTSSMAAGIAPYIPCVDKIIVSDVPWVKNNAQADPRNYFELIEKIKKHAFDAAVVFTVFSQNPLPAVMIAYLAAIPYRLAYCRENPYQLLTHWVPDAEPYSYIRHQVIRDLDLVASVGAQIKNQRLSLKVPNQAYSGMMDKIKKAGVSITRPWIVVHAGASEAKRQYPSEEFKIILKNIAEKLNVQMILTGTEKEKQLVEQIHPGIEASTFSVAGALLLEEFMALIDVAPLVLTVNTATVHIASALNTPVIVLYALTNPQHTPWAVKHEVFTFPVKETMQSRNEVLRYLSEHIMDKSDKMPDAGEVVEAVRKLLQTARSPLV